MTAGSITTIVEELKERSSLASIDPEGEVYKYLNIEVGDEGFANSNNIENAVVGFNVNKKWIAENDINKDTITFQHFNNNQWDPLETEKVDEDDDYVYLKAKTPGFSPFAITASKKGLGIGDGDEGQSTQGAEQQGNSDSVIGSEMPSEENGNSILKIASFFIGFLVIIAMGAIIKKKADKKNDGENSEK